MNPDGQRAPQSLVEGCVQWVRTRIKSQVLLPGARLPSIRALARKRGVSPFTVAEAYGRLAANGDVDARRGSGFYVKAFLGEARPTEPKPRPKIDLQWLMDNMLHDRSAHGPGIGTLPASWLDGAQLGGAIRAVGREGRWLDSGQPNGYAPLRSLLQQRLAAVDILARQEQIVLTTGVSHALTLVLTTLVQPSDTVLVLEPSWFGAIGILGKYGARVAGIPLTQNGPDFEVMERLMREERPPLMVISSACQNPTGLSLTQAAVARMLALARRFNVIVFEDDVYSDLCGSPVVRAAAEDKLQHVIYAGSFSKTLSANIRVGYLATAPELARTLSNNKILTGFTTPELNERVALRLLTGRRYHKHVEHLRERLSEKRAAAKRMFAAEGIEIFLDANDGMFLWVNMRSNTDRLAARCREHDMLIAPGSLFTASQAATSWMRFNVTTPIDSRLRSILFASDIPEPSARSARSFSGKDIP